MLNAHGESVASESVLPAGRGEQESQREPPDPGVAGERSLADEVAAQTTAVGEQYESILRRLDELGIEKHVFSQMHEELRAFREKSHEREVLLPIWRSVIAVVDRCLEQTRKLRGVVKAFGPSMDTAVTMSMQQVIASRQADLVELEALLARFGVERFLVGGSRFDPRQQESVKRVAASHDRPPGQIAARIFPGYRRNGTIVRRECVSVFASTNQGPDPSSERRA